MSAALNASFRKGQKALFVFVRYAAMGVRSLSIRAKLARSQVRPLGFDPATASQVSRPVAICPTNLNSAFRLRRSGTDETSLVSNLVTDLVTGHTCKRPSPNGKGPLTCDDVGSGGRI